ncbi:MAG: hypothetical protein AAGF11_07915 [Myxococcota bacterium]
MPGVLLMGMLVSPVFAVACSVLATRGNDPQTRRRLDFVLNHLFNDGICLVVVEELCDDPPRTVHLEEVKLGHEGATVEMILYDHRGRRSSDSLCHLLRPRVFK